MRRHLTSLLPLFVVVLFCLPMNPIAGQEEEGSVDVSELMAEAGSYLQNSDFADAADVFEQIVKHEPDNGRAWHLLGYSLHMDGQLDAAIKAHTKATEFDDFKPIALYNLCCAYSLKEENEKALKYLKKSLMEGFDDFAVMEEDSDLDNIRDEPAFEKLISAAKEGTLGESEEGHGEASEELMGDIDISGEAEEMMEQGNELLADEQYLKAAEMYHQVVEMEPKFGPGWFQLGYALHAGGELEKAIECHKKAAKFERFAGVATYNLGCAYALQDKTDEAFEALGKAAKLGFTDVGQYESDSDLDSLRDDERFEKLMSHVEELADKGSSKEKDKDSKKSKDGNSDF